MRAEAARTAKRSITAPSPVADPPRRAGLDLPVHLPDTGGRRKSAPCSGSMRQAEDHASMNRRGRPTTRLLRPSSPLGLPGTTRHPIASLASEEAPAASPRRGPPSRPGRRQTGSSQSPQRPCAFPTTRASAGSENGPRHASARVGPRRTRRAGVHGVRSPRASDARSEREHAHPQGCPATGP